jgi:hypothetical protein
MNGEGDILLSRRDVGLHAGDGNGLDGEGSSGQTEYIPSRAPSKRVKRPRRSYVCILVSARVAAGVGGDARQGAGKARSCFEQRACASAVTTEPACR